MATTSTYEDYIAAPRWAGVAAGIRMIAMLSGVNVLHVTEEKG